MACRSNDEVGRTARRPTAVAVAFVRQAALLAVTLGVIVAAAPVSAADDDTPPQYGWRLDGRAFLRLGEGIETPHTPWCRPAAGGPIRALLLLNSSAAFDAAELGQRLEMKIAGMPTPSWLRLGDNYWLSLWLEASACTERSAYLERLLDEPYDVIVLGNFRFESLYDTVRYKIVRKVANSCGLVMFYAHDTDPRLFREPLPDAPARIAAGVPFAGMDFYRDIFMPQHDLLRADEVGANLLLAHQFGRGRVLVVDFGTQSSVFAAVPGAMTPYETYSYAAPVQYDYHMSLAARCVQWAAGREPHLAWTTALPDGIEIAALTETPPVHVEAAWTGAADARLVGRLRVRNRWGDVEFGARALLEGEPATPLAIRDGTVAWDVPMPPLPGGTHFVDMIVTADGRVENWASFSVDVRAPLRIDAIEPSESYYEQDAVPTGRIVLSEPVADGDDVRIALSLEDGYGRIASSTVLPVPAGTDRLDYRIERGQIVSWGARLRARLLRGGICLHEDEAEFRVWRPDRGDFPIAMWGAVSGYGNHIGNLQMRRLGFTAVLTGDPLAQARDDLGWMTFGHGRGALIHSLGDEIPIPTPKPGAAFGRFLHTRYDSIDALNKAWATSFATFDEAEPLMQPRDGVEADFVRLHDSLSGGEFAFAEMCRTKREAIEKSNPIGVVGPEGSPVGDPELTLPQVTFWGPYLTVRDNLLTSAIGRPGMLRGNWYGGYVEDRQIKTRLRHVLWLSILGGNNMIEYFTIEGGLLAPDLTRMPFTDEFIESWQQLQGGLGPMLARCRPCGNPVALLHSQPSEHVGTAGGDWTDTTKVHEFMLNLLGDAGYSPQYVATGQVLAGRLRDERIRVLMLLHAFALSDAEIKEIVAFADRGGTVIADIPPAWFDERCRVRGERGMDAFFGIAPERPTASLAARLKLMQEPGAITMGDETMRVRGRDSAIGDASGAAGSKPIVREHGRGRSILLNGVIWKDGREDHGTIRAMHGLLEHDARTPPAFAVTYRRPLGKVGSKAYSYERGDIRVDAVLPPEATDPAIAVEPELSWDRPMHTYDLRTMRYLGRVDRVTMTVERASPAVVARLPYKVGAVRVEAPTTARAGETATVRCVLSDADGTPRPGHVIRVEVRDPAGGACGQYGAMLSADGATQEMRIPFAQNDATGEWRIAATDVISGVAGEATIRLEAPSNDRPAK